MDLHHNLFYGYRGAISDEGARERQLENNVTKALINTLHLGGEAVWRPFLAKIGVPGAAQAEFLLQKADLPSGSASLKKRRVLLGISSASPDWHHASVSDDTYASVPDAWIYGDGFAVLVESKVAGNFGSSGVLVANRVGQADSVRCRDERSQRTLPITSWAQRRLESRWRGSGPLGQSSHHRS